MTEDAATAQTPLWLSMEQEIAALSSEDVGDKTRERTIQKLAAALDDAGYEVSKHGRNMLELRWAIDARAEVGEALKDQLDDALEALTLDELADTGAAVIGLVRELGEDWPRLMEVDRRDDVTRIVARQKLDLMVAKADKLEDDLGIRYLIAEQVEATTIVAELDISEERYQQVVDAIAAEKAEVARVDGLLEKVADKSEIDKAKHLMSNDVSDENIVALAEIAEAVVAEAREALAEEMKEKERKAAEEEAAKKKAAEGPSLDDIPDDEMLEHIEALREIMEFSEVEAEIRQMAEQSALPKALIDIAVSDPDKLDELEAKAEG